MQSFALLGHFFSNIRNSPQYIEDVGDLTFWMTVREESQEDTRGIASWQEGSLQWIKVEWPRFGKAKLLSGIPHRAARRGRLLILRRASQGGRCFDNAIDYV